MTIIKLKKIIKLLEDEKVRKQNRLEGSHREIIRDIQLFSSKLNSYDFKTPLNKGFSNFQCASSLIVNPQFRIQGFSKKAYENVVNADKDLLKATEERKEVELKRFFTLNVLYDPDDPIFSHREPAKVHPL